MHVQTHVAAVFVSLSLSLMKRLGLSAGKQVIECFARIIVVLFSFTLFFFVLRGEKVQCHQTNGHCQGLNYSKRINEKHCVIHNLYYSMSSCVFMTPEFADCKENVCKLL